MLVGHVLVEAEVNEASVNSRITGPGGQRLARPEATL